MIQDITERKLADERLARIAETQRDIAAAGLDLRSVMELIAERAMALTVAEGAMVSLLEGDELVVGAAVGRGQRRARNTRRRLEDSIASHAFAARDTLLIEHAEDDPRLNAAIRAKVGDRSHICVPLFAGDRPVATLNVMTRSADVPRLGEEDRQTLELLAVVLSSAVSRAAEFEAKRAQVEALARFEATYAGALDRHDADLAATAGSSTPTRRCTSCSDDRRATLEGRRRRGVRASRGRRGGRAAVRARAGRRRRARCASSTASSAPTARRVWVDGVGVARARRRRPRRASRSR